MCRGHWIYMDIVKLQMNYRCNKTNGLWPSLILENGPLLILDPTSASLGNCNYTQLVYGDHFKMNSIGKSERQATYKWQGPKEGDGDICTCKENPLPAGDRRLPDDDSYSSFWVKAPSSSTARPPIRAHYQRVTLVAGQISAGGMCR